VVHDFGKEEVVCVQPAFNFLRSAHNQIDRNLRVEPVQNFSGFSPPACLPFFGQELASFGR
jgi:hypothetical protein